MLTLKKINAEIAKKHPHVEVVRGKGYFYLWSKDDATALMLAGLYENSIPAFRVNQFTLKMWVDSVDYILTHDRNIRYK